MDDYCWSDWERRDLYLAASTLADEKQDGDWVQWASDTLLKGVEICDLLAIGVGVWLFSDEEPDAAELGRRLSDLVGSDPFKAVALISENPAAAKGLRIAASRLRDRMRANGRRCPI